MQNYIEKKEQVSHHIFFLRKTNQNHIRQFSTFISTKRTGTKNCI